MDLDVAIGSDFEFFVVIADGIFKTSSILIPKKV
jgi:hypothetical protein